MSSWQAVNIVAIGSHPISQPEPTISIGLPATEYNHINIGQIDVLALMARIEALEAQVLELRYAPGMPGAVEAEASFNNQIEE